jgi:hypothetical protein
MDTTITAKNMPVLSSKQVHFEPYGDLIFNTQKEYEKGNMALFI